MKSSTTSLFPLARPDAVLAPLLGLGSLVLYLRTLAPGLLYGDSGEFQTLVYSLGMSHPTGYPVYILLGRLFTMLPLGGLAWRINLFSAVLGALTVSCIYLIVRLLAGWRLAAVTAALALAVAPLFWAFSIITELYVPSCAFLSGIILLLLLWRRSGKLPWLGAAALLGGLSLGVHPSVALAAPAVLMYLALITLTPGFLTRRERGRIWLAAVSGALLGVGLAFAAFLVLDARNPAAGYYHATVEPALSVWGMTPADFDSPLERLKFLYAARQFRYAMFADPAVTMPSIARTYMNMLPETFAPLTLGLMGTGIIALFFPRWREGLLLLAGWGVQLVFITNYNIYDVLVFFIPTFVFLGIWIGTGLGALMKALSWGARRLRWEKAATPMSVLLGIAVLGLTIQFRGGMMVDAWKARMPTFLRHVEIPGYPFPIDHPGAVQTEAQGIVDSVEEDAIVFVPWDLLYPCYFVAHIEESRTSLDFHETYPQEGVSRLADSTLAYIEANIDQRPIYMAERPAGLSVNYKVIHAGAGLYRILRKE